jgi:MFS family permease
VTATAQPLVGYISDHIGVRFSFTLWLLTMGTVAFLIPLFVKKMKKDETIDQILSGNLYPNDYLFLLIGNFFGYISLQTSVTSAITHLFGIYSGGRTLAVVRTVSRILGLLCALLPVYLNNWQT